MLLYLTKLLILHKTNMNEKKKDKMVENIGIIQYYQFRFSYFENNSKNQSYLQSLICFD